MSGGVLGIDTSHYGTGSNSPIPTQAQINKAWDFGIRFWSVGLQDHNIFIPTLERILSDGRILPETYTYLYNSLGPRRQLDWGMNKLAQAGLLPDIYRHWLDYEDGVEQPGSGENALAKSLHWAIEREYNTRGGLYTGGWWWNANVPQRDPEVAQIPLWNAYYDKVASPTWVPFGGWARMHTKQFQGTTDLYGLNTDLNWRPQDIWEAEMSGDDQEEDDLATPQALIQALEDSNYDQLGKILQLLNTGPLSMIGLPPSVPVDAHGNPSQNGLNHWVKDSIGRIEAASVLSRDDIRETVGEAMENILNRVRLSIPE
jgi:hypothetical protein